MPKYIADCLRVGQSKPVLPNLSVPAKSGKFDERNFWWGWVSTFIGRVRIAYETVKVFSLIDSPQSTQTTPWMGEVEQCTEQLPRTRSF
jgi:hypothetical protein